MNTEYFNVSPGNPNADAIARAGAILRRGGLVAFPTETVYGLGGNALDPDASRRIYAAKGRPSDNPLIVHIADPEDLPPLVREIPENTAALVRAFWPGPLTLIFQKAEHIPYQTTGGLDTVAVRCPSDPVASAMIRAAGIPIAAPSANASGRPSPTTAQRVREDLDGKIDMILDGGPVGIGLESTILDLTVSPPTILRPGYITREMLAELIPDVRVDQALLNPDSPIRPKAPGMKYRHYAPKAPLTIVEGEPEAVIRSIRRLSEAEEAAGRKVGILAAEETASRYDRGFILSAGARDHEDTIAHNLFEALRTFDEKKVDVIYSEAFDTPRIGHAIMNRLLKAAGHHVIRADES